MKSEIQNMQLSVQAAVDELFCEHLIPFKLTAYKINAKGLGEYVVPFHDSRLHSIRFYWRGDGSFRELVRATTLDHLEKMTGAEVLEWVSILSAGNSYRPPLLRLVAASKGA